MDIRTVTLDAEAYMKLEANSLPDDSFSDVVRRLSSGFALVEYYGILDEETAEEIENDEER